MGYNWNMARILVVEDDAEIRILWAEALTQIGHEVDVAGDGVQAIKQISSQRYNIILFDLFLPRLSGLDAIKLIRRTEPDLAILAVTGGVESDLTRQVRAAGVADVLYKPIELRKLLQAISRLAPSQPTSIR